MQWRLSSLLLLPRLAAAATGQGPRGVHPINERYVAVADSSIDAVLVVDGHAGGAVVGHLVLHDRAADADPSGWFRPVGLATCRDCKHLYVLSGDELVAVSLDRPLAAMAEDHDFSTLADATPQPYWPDGWKAQYRGDGLLRALSVAPDGGSAYLAHASAGLFAFDPLHPTAGNRRARHVLHAGQADVGPDVRGLHHTSSLKNLVVTRDRFVHIVALVDDEGQNPLERGYPEAYEIPLDEHCARLYDGADMTFRDAVIINEFLFVLGQPTRSASAAHNGVALYRLTWYGRNGEREAWHDCTQVAGSGLRGAAWVDGPGHAARFSATPRDLAVLPVADAHVIVVGDTDNRALRYVDVTVPVEDYDATDMVRVSTLAYDQDLYQVLYAGEEPWTNLSPEDVMEQDGKSYYHSGEDSVYSMDFAAAQDECGRVGLGRVCTLPEIRARFARGQYPTVDGDDSSWSTVWTAQSCASCHLQGPGRCPLGEDSDDAWGHEFKMIAAFSPRKGLQNQCVHAETSVDTMSMCCGVGGPAVLNAANDGKSSAEAAASADAKKAGVISAGVVVPLLLIAAVAGYGFHMKDKPKPSWWPKFLRSDSREETGHAPHREVDLRGRDYI